MRFVFFWLTKAKKEMGEKAQQQKRRENERARDGEQQHNPRREVWATESGIDPGTLTLGHVIHDQ
jgi:hypothetical protein